MSIEEARANLGKEVVFLADTNKEKFTISFVDRHNQVGIEDKNGKLSIVKPDCLSLLDSGDKWKYTTKLSVALEQWQLGKSVEYKSWNSEFYNLSYSCLDELSEYKTFRYSK